MKRWLVCRVVGVAVAAGLMAAGAYAQDAAKSANEETINSTYEQEAAGNVNVETVTSTGAASGGASQPGGGSSGAAPAASLKTGYGWNFMAGYDFLDSSLTIGSNNGTCSLCLGRDIISGWHFGGSRMFTENFGITFDYSGHNTHGCWSCADKGEVDQDEDDQFLLGGMTLIKQITPKIRIFGEALGGTMFAGARDLGPGHHPIAGESIGHHWGPSLAVGGGLEVMASRRFGIRIFQFDYIWGDFNMSTSFIPQNEGHWGSVNDVRMSTGVIMHLGGPN